MAGFLSNFRNTIVASLVLAALFVAAFGYFAPDRYGMNFVIAVLRWAHVACGILWVGLLYYFNFVQIRVMPNIPAELKPAISKYIAPEALFWFRWAALLTVILGLTLAGHRGYLLQTLTLGFGVIGHAGVVLSHTPTPQFTLLGIGMWLGIIMMFNVWGVIWPAQKIALGIKDAPAEKKAAAAKRAMVFSRFNTLLSLPMLVAMTMYQTLFN
jgi:uncharacterized membrane protein